MQKRQEEKQAAPLEITRLRLVPHYLDKKLNILNAKSYHNPTFL
jgi:hypothetical protein